MRHLGSLCEVPSPRCHSGQWPQGGSVCSEIHPTIGKLPLVGPAGKVQACHATGQQQTRSTPHRRGGSLWQHPSQESEVIPPNGSQEPTGWEMWIVTCAISQGLPDGAGKQAAQGN